ncbi:Peptidase family M23 [Corynebacterium atrinae]|uniref:M23 family metallopeptidase n=1 Tax=Corynebacterium atrinae TaxID=1336740 RepID=UPI0025B3F036|nr:M23 family metallopeptidase [Corynebacterium atrinae]WJY63699.1 Peptidase family M23 [Corynebacterium atrinae]
MRTFIITVPTVLVAFLVAAPAFAYVDPSTGASTASGVIRAFDKPAQNWLPGHRGVDLRLSVGSDVLASGSGVVAFAGTVAGTPTVSIDHPDGVRTTYQPVHPLISAGDLVKEGSVIGRLAHPTTQWPGLQWGAKRGEDYLNPLSLLDATTIRLKPSPAGVAL